MPEGPVPVEVKLVVWVNREGWNKEYDNQDDDFEESVQDWVIEEMQSYGVDGDNWPNVERVTR